MNQPLEIYKRCIIGPWMTAGKDTQYRIEEDEDHIYLFLEGSTSKQDWIDNFNFPAVPYRNMPVRWMAHRGFIRAWKEARDAIVEDIAQRPGFKSIIVAGFSHGGALATLAHEECVFRGWDVTTYTYGSPRVLWLPGGIVKGRFDKLYRYKVRGDIVTLLPPSLLGYVHIGKRNALGKINFPWHTNHYIDRYLNTLE